MDPDLMKLSVRRPWQKDKKNTHPVIRHLRLQPFREHARGFDEQELAISVYHFHPDVFVTLRQFAEKIYHHPFILNRVAIIRASL